MKSANGWHDAGNGSNSSGFTGLPGGYYSTNGSFLVGQYGYWWSSTQLSATNAWLRGLIYYNTVVYRANDNKRAGFSVRCVRD
jgi:uncharacterized protein (TIGR02145 family)